MKLHHLGTTLFIGVAALTAACGSDSSTSGVKVSARLANVALSGTAAVLGEIQNFGKAFTSPSVLTVGSTASISASGLESMKYVIGQMDICEELNTNGSAFSSGTNCVTIYDWGKGGGAETVTAATFANYADVTVDMASTSSISSFNTRNSGTVAAGNYKYVTINWAPYIAVKGSIAVGATTVRTQECSLTTSGSLEGLCTSSTSLSTASANAEALTKSANGGTWFKFQNPFVVSQADIDAGTSFSIDMVFNPAGALSASTSYLPSSYGYGMITDSNGVVSGNGIYVPMLQLTPVPRKTGEVTSRETYSITLPSNSGTARVELYYNKSDTAKTVYGVNVITLLTTSNDGSFAQIDNGSKIATIDTAADGSLSLNFTDGSSVVSGLKRAQAGTVSIKWLGGNSGTSAATASYTYDGTSDLN